MCRMAARLREEGVDTRIVLIDERGSGCLCATLKTPTVPVRGGHLKPRARPQSNRDKKQVYPGTIKAYALPSTREKINPSIIKAYALPIKNKMEWGNIQREGEQYKELKMNIRREYKNGKMKDKVDN